MTRPSPRGPLAGLLLLVLAGAAGAQLAQGAVHERHLRAVYAERLDDFLAAWEVAAPPSRDACVALFAAARGDDGPIDAWPDLRALSAGRRVLAGVPPDGLGVGSPEALVDALDLVVVPGTIEPRAAGDDRGEPLTVRVYPADPRTAALSARDVELELRWVSPTGEEQVARREAVAAQALRAPGFDVYVRAPAAVFGETLHLVPVLFADPDVEVRGEAVPVECVPGFRETFLEAHAAFAARVDGPYDFDLGLALEELRDLFVHGCRATRGDGAAALLAHASARAERRAPPPVTARPLGAPGATALAAGPALWVREPAQAPRATVVLVAPERVAAEAAFHGRIGEAWAAAADRAGLRLVSADLASFGARPIGSLLADVDARWPVQPIVLVTRGDVTGRYLLERLDWRGPEVAALVLGSAVPELGSALPDVPLRFVGPGEPGPRRVVVDAPLVVVEEALPGHVADHALAVLGAPGAGGSEGE